MSAASVEVTLNLTCARGGRCPGGTAPQGADGRGGQRGEGRPESVKALCKLLCVPPTLGFCTPPTPAGTHTHSRAHRPLPRFSSPGWVASGQGGSGNDNRSVVTRQPCVGGVQSGERGGQFPSRRQELWVGGAPTPGWDSGSVASWTGLLGPSAQHLRRQMALTGLEEAG